MHKLVRALKAAVLLIAALPLATVGNHAVGLAPAQVVLAAANPSGSATVAAAARPTPARAAVAARRSAPTRHLQRAITDLQANTDEERLDDLREELDEEIEDLQADLDDIEADLDDRDADLDRLRDSVPKTQAEATLRVLEARLGKLQRLVREIRTTGSLADAQELGVAIRFLRNDIRALDVLINRAEQRGEEDDDDEQQSNNDEERNQNNDDDRNSDDD